METKNLARWFPGSAVQETSPVLLALPALTLDGAPQPACPHLPREQQRWKTRCCVFIAMAGRQQSSLHCRSIFWNVLFPLCDQPLSEYSKRTDHHTGHCCVWAGGPRARCTRGPCLKCGQVAKCQLGSSETSLSFRILRLIEMMSSQDG